MIFMGIDKNESILAETTNYTHSMDNKELDDLRNHIPFDSKFKELLNFFYFDDKTEVYEYLKENERILSIIDNIKCTLTNYFKGESYILRIVHNPEIEYSYLDIIIKVDYDKGLDDLLDKLKKVNSEIRPLKRKYDLIGTFSIDLECI